MALANDIDLIGSGSSNSSIGTSIYRIIYFSSKIILVDECDNGQQNCNKGMYNNMLVYKSFPIEQLPLWAVFAIAVVVILLLCNVLIVGIVILRR